MVALPDPLAVAPPHGTTLADDLRNPTLVSFLDMARWVAAAVVFVSHLRGPLFLGYGDIAAEVGPGIKIWYFVTGLHAEAVIVFFVLSGFLVGGVALGRVRTGRFDAPDYAAARIARLFVPFLPAVALTLLLDSIGAHALSASGFWDHSHPMLAEKIATAPFETLLDLRTVLGNVAMLQTIVVEPIGSNQPLWTISLEFWFYAVFGVLALGLATSAAPRWALVAVSAVMAVVLGTVFLVYFALWAIGALLALVGRPRRIPWLAAFLLFLGIVAAARLFQSVTDAGEGLRTAKNIVVALSFALLLACTRGRQLWLIERFGPLNRWLADFSYSLYLVHYPVMLFVLAILSEVFGLTAIRNGYHPNDPQGLVVYAGVLVAVYAVAWGFAQMTERRTAPVRAALRKRLRFGKGHRGAVTGSEP
ncbi:acyltransferase family protein [Anianabacter salinae]|uniref:acyltransferase family protein n=1 Tax=Anianabacter salinae TaxID=2851023 RepID=UPI00225E183D|nr:acyltransferase [Anianabacter salinae]MBV0913468.1 acyltransferase [Anianabacter salinae]